MFCDICSTNVIYKEAYLLFVGYMSLTTLTASVGRGQMLGHLDIATEKTGISYSARLQTEPTDRSWLLGSYAAFK